MSDARFGVEQYEEPGPHCFREPPACNSYRCGNPEACRLLAEDDAKAEDRCRLDLSVGLCATVRMRKEVYQFCPDRALCRDLLQSYETAGLTLQEYREYVHRRAVEEER